ncbi:MAG TPA: sigma-70 family RNA polymerase sigma factor [Chthonomonadaceae bacterium]|nr:sigma-70 family RNA polymerase sigma factor [Chthonomonadaceae bacterium]
MELGTLVSRIRAGDICAFTELVRRYQDMAFGYAFSILHDFQLAEDAAQEAFLAVYADLGALAAPEAFPGWLRGIVRHQCQRILRKRRLRVVPLAQARDMAESAPGPERQAERKEMQERVLAAIRALPRAEREVTTLYYIQEYSQQEIAAFLEVPVSKVNNRLHAARARLKRRMLPMVKETFQEHALPEDFAERVGRIVQVQGPLVDAQFAPEKLPAVFSALTVQDPAHKQPVTVEVAQHLGNGVVRCIALAPAAGLKQGMEIINTGAPASQPVASETLHQLAQALGKERTEKPELLETGIKALDLLCPYARGGKVGLFAEWGLGLLVLIPEIIHNIATHQPGVWLFTFVQPMANPKDWQQVTAEIAVPEGEIQTIYIPTADPNDPVIPAQFDFLDARTYLARHRARQRLYPAIDPLRSNSRLLDPALVGQEHVEVANGVRQLLQRCQELQPHLESTGREALSEEEKTLAARGRRVERFLTQPFFVAAPFTGVPGQYVPVQETVRDFKALLAGEYDALPEEAFLYCGTLAQVVEKANAAR